ncbi:Fc.00g092220.m01.CDS01 [Cosmosporella sp. VM-42]
MARDSSCKSIDITSVVEEKPEAVNVEALGRKRPDVLLRHGWGLPLSAPCWFRSLWRTSSSEAFRPSCLLSWDLFIFPRLQKTWPSSVITLVAGAFILPCGRLADMFGGYIVFHVGIIWFIAWTIITGFSNSFLMLVFCRAMEGLGAAMFLPAGVSLLGRIYRPGPRKNFIFSLYGAITPIGFFSGIMIGGMSSQVMTWGWYFWIGAMLTTLCCIASLLTSPRDYVDVRKQGVTMDWWGFCTMVPGLTLFIYAITDSRQASEGWASPQIIVCLVLGVLFLGAAIYVEGWKASAPLIPPEIFQVKFMKRMILTLFLTWGVFALYLFFANS